MLSSVFALADLLELRESNPVNRVPKIKFDPKQPALLTNEQYEALVKACEEVCIPIGRASLCVRVLNGETGARDESEALWLRWEDLSTSERLFVTIVSGRDGQGGKTRLVPMTPVLKAALKDLFAYRFASASPWIFHYTVARRLVTNAASASAASGGPLPAQSRVRTSRSSPDQADQIPARWVMHDLRHRRVTVA